MTRRIILHIGLEKTGTTSLQTHLTDNQAALLRAGVLYPTERQIFFKNNHAPFAAAYLGENDPDFTLVRRRPSRDMARQTLLRSIARSDAPTILLSAEHLSSRLRHREIAAMAADLDGFEVRIAMTVRNHAARLLSSYSTHIDSGGDLMLDVYANAYLAAGNHYLRVRDTIEPWEQVFGRAAIDIFDYDQHPDVIPVMIAAYAPAMSRAIRRPYRDKIALKPAAAEAVRMINIAVASRQPIGDNSLHRWLQRRYFERRLAAQVTRQVKPGSQQRWRLPADTAARLATVAAADRDWLAAAYGFVPAEIASPYDEIPSGMSVPASDSAALLAEALVDATSLRWSSSQALVGLIDRIRTRRR